MVIFSLLGCHQRSDRGGCPHDPPIRPTGAAAVLRRLQSQKRPRLTSGGSGLLFSETVTEPKVWTAVQQGKRPKPEGRHKPLGALPRSGRLLHFWARRSSLGSTEYQSAIDVYDLPRDVSRHRR